LGSKFFPQFLANRQEIPGNSGTFTCNYDQAEPTILSSSAWLCGFVAIKLIYWFGVWNGEDTLSCGGKISAFSEVPVVEEEIWCRQLSPSSSRWEFWETYTAEASPILVAAE
jgi:hypothetical protein